MEKILMLGCDAIARGAVEAGISYASSYPGTPATQILEYIAKNSSTKAEWSVNEKVAYEVAYGVSLTGRRVLCSMKHVGLNVASDPFMTSAYLGIKGGFVLVLGDDPGAYSSQNEQDSRFYASFAKIPCLEPSDAQEAKDMTKLAFDISEELGLPVMIRSITRLLHCISPVTLENIKPEKEIKLDKNPEYLLAIPKNVVRLHSELNKKQEKIKKLIEKYEFNKIFSGKGKTGIIACGITYLYAKELGEDLPILKISAYPINEDLIKNFVKNLNEVIVLEEGYPFIESLVKKYCLNVKGKLSGDLPLEGELCVEPLLKLFGKIKSYTQNLPLIPRPPVLCPGCPHREFYKALNEAHPNFVTGDIGCYTLGANPPLKAIDTCLCMGASISKASGIASQGIKRVAAVIGDSTFIHSGIPALINAVYNKSDILVCILDNSSVAMTGHQPTPAVGITAKGEETKKIDLVELCKACGADSVEVVDPYDKKSTFEAIKKGLNEPGVNVVIARRACILVAKKLKS
ncbi:thiamine pyrophosphate-dependent enzyme [Thermodesulfovibrio yellowstonii]|uniref:Indolepyruvate oxidoreductase subunit IorA n=1 Tax=Thermodesulfovibrio yellowstonii TaxID=28262 RepID=A0A9W6GHD1_9BACT|nr:thiamine pyrophosphate-dependent enzyme [Thermodesulfovibrio islandicus]GLI53826.1 indolepyruvate oxidoreductase subunit IorA [Thermodesulfovibrio islandicus]